MSVHALILCHQLNPGLKDLLSCLSTSGLPMSIHLDAKCSRSGIDQFIEGLDAPQNVTMLENRKACAWGEFSLVSATLDLLRSALARDAEASHFILLSGNCFPVKSLKTFQAYLQQNPGRDFIETYPLSGNHKWTKGGFEKQRFDYRHFFNFQSHKRLFGLSWKAQRLLGIKQKHQKGSNSASERNGGVCPGKLLKPFLACLKPARRSKNISNTPGFQMNRFFKRLSVWLQSQKTSKAGA